MDQIQKNDEIVTAIQKMGDKQQGDMQVAIKEGMQEFGKTMAKVFADELKHFMADFMVNNQNNQLDNFSNNYTVENLDNLIEEKASNEICATLFGKMTGNRHPSKFRTFYTFLEQKTGIPLSALHKERVKEIAGNGDGRFPYRKIDSVIMKLGQDFVYSEAKKFEFKQH